MMGYGSLISSKEGAAASRNNTAWHMRYEKEPVIRHIVDIIIEIL